MCKHRQINCPHCSVDWSRYAPEVEALSDAFEYRKMKDRAIEGLRKLYATPPVSVDLEARSRY